MSVSFHKHYISSDAEDMERAAGYMKIKYKENIDSSPEYASMCLGACCALYAISNHDLKTPEDFYRIWDIFIDSQLHTRCSYE